MTKQTLRGLVAAFAVLVVAYLFGAFVYAEWNTARWDAGDRAFGAVVVLTLGFLAFMGVSNDR